MAQLPTGTFNAAEVEPLVPMEASPEFTGWHSMHFTDSEMKQTRDGQGQYLQLVAEVLEGPFKGRMLWTRLNLVNRNDKAVEIAYRELSAICHAVGVLNVQDSAQLHHRPFLGNVKFVPADAKGPAKNELAGYKARTGATPPSAPATAAAPVAPAPAPAPAAPAAASVPPWKKGRTVAA